MFTGIVQLIGQIERAARRTGGQSFDISIPASWREVWAGWPGAGESISINGACLTVERGEGERLLSFFASDETLEKSTLGLRRAGDGVNLERAATLQSLLGGHLVSGHVDGRGALRGVRAEGDSRVLTFEIPAAVASCLVEKGSIAIDGISLTAVNVQGNQCDVWIIPHTWEATTLPSRRVGDAVNVEADLIAKMVAKQLGAWLGRPEGSVGTGRDLAELLKQAGFQ